MSAQELSKLKTSIYQNLLDLATADGINASGKDEIYGCIFGRDSALTILKLLKTHSKNPSPQLLEICRKALLTLTRLQGKEFNPESGEEPGKFIHEYRKNNFDHLIALNWFVYPDGLLRNYDSIDSTPLGLIAIYRYYELTQDSDFLIEALPAVERGLNWIITFGDKDKDFLIEYEIPKERKHAGLMVHSWTDSHESLLNPRNEMPEYPIAPVEAQSYAWLAVKLWGDFYASHSVDFSRKLTTRADQIKEQFNKLFILKDHGCYYGAQALDGVKNQIGTITGNPLIALWATYDDNGKKECIISEEYLLDFVKRGFMADLFDYGAGIRTMSMKSKTFDPSTDSYHNGSFWPVLNGLIHEGLEKWGFTPEADALKSASMKAIEYFGSPIELYIRSSDGNYQEYRNSKSGQVGCRIQAWSAAAAWDWLN